MASVHLIVRGRVQGVGYRAWLAGEAGRRGLAGWARNRADGTVEAVITGGDDAVAALLGACRQGPPAASVSGIDHRPAGPDEAAMASGYGFAVLPTA